MIDSNDLNAEASKLLLLLLRNVAFLHAPAYVANCCV